jgi:alanine racemase
MKSISLKIHHKMKEFKEIYNSILQINLKNIQNNYDYLKRNAPNTIIAACVKANSYGLGSNEICKALYKKNCRDFFVATLEEALLLRRKYKYVNIYMLNGVNHLDSFFDAFNSNIITVINNLDQFLILKNFFKIKKKRIKCCLHFDTGMNRLGLKLKDFNRYIYPFHKNLDIKLVISHLINSEKKSVLNDNQLKLFTDIKKKFKFSKKTLFSLGNSNSIFLRNNFHFDMIRAGGFIYGLDLTKKVRSKNVLLLKAKIIQIESVKKGKSIGYGAKYITKKDSIIATLAIGYADGLPRKYDGFAFYKKKKIKFVGNVSMDLSCIDVSSIKNPKINDWVEIFGNNISISVFASKCNTITYEVSSKIGLRVKRIYN